MPLATITYNGTQIADTCSHVSVEVRRLTEPALQAGLKRPLAIQTDPSANVYYLLRCQVHYRGTDMLAVAGWVADLGEFLKLGLKTVVITEGSTTLTMGNAALLGPIAPPAREEANAALVRALELTFRSITKPVALQL